MVVFYLQVALVVLEAEREQQRLRVGNGQAGEAGGDGEGRVG
jgi:hypothetical protein